MALSIKKFFNRIGNLTVDSGKKVGETGKKVGESVQTPVSKLSKIKTIKPRKAPPRVLKRMKMSKEEIDMLKGLIEKKAEIEVAEEEKTEVEKKAEEEKFKKAALEELLKEEEREGLDPKLIMGMGITSFVVVFVVVSALGFGVDIAIILGMLILVMSGVLVYLPSLQRGKRTSEVSRELPYALRQMATELRAGLGLHDSMRSVALSGYGALSEEFARALEEIRYGETTENALLDMSNRIQSEGLKRAVHQITRTLASGGDLAKTLNIIADDVAYEIRMKLRDYAQKLNAFTMIYMMIAILMPVIVLVMLIAATTVMGPVIPPQMLLIIYLFLFPAMVAFMAFMIKRFEPEV